jgi:putative SOS response-associated peptidase YedK
LSKDSLQIERRKLAEQIDLPRPFSAEEMKALKVSQAVDNVRNNGPELLVPTR